VDTRYFWPSKPRRLSHMPAPFSIEKHAVVCPGCCAIPAILRRKHLLCRGLHRREQGLYLKQEQR
jgi:hypothetical protein